MREEIVGDSSAREEKMDDEEGGTVEDGGEDMSKGMVTWVTRGGEGGEGEGIEGTLTVVVAEKS